MLGIKAFAILSSTNEIFFEKILIDNIDLIKSEVDKVINKNDLMLINRLAVIIQNCFYKASRKVNVNDLDFLFTMLKHIVKTLRKFKNILSKMD